MKKRNLPKIVVCIIALLIVANARSQGDYAYKASLGNVDATRFYKIDLPTQVVALCKKGLEDIRIFDEDGKQVSYILKEDLPTFKIENFTEFPIIKISREKDKQTHITLHNTTESAISNLLLFIKNMDAPRAISITGSDDSLHWFIIKENMYLENTFSNDGDINISTLSFPISNYKYFQLTISGKDVIPFNIIKAGIYKTDVLYGRYVALPKPVITQKDSADKKSYVTLAFDNFYRIDKISIRAEGLKYFKRSFTISEINKGNSDYLLNGYLISDSTNSFTINSKTNHLQVIINNEDNAPLAIKSAEAFQLNISLLTYLQANKKYYLYFGDSTAQFPKYDLDFFKDSAEKSPVAISVKQVEPNVVKHESGKTISGNSKLKLWIMIAAILAVLSFFTFKMMKEVERKKGE